MLRTIFSFLLAIFILSASSQSTLIKERKKRGELYFTWGYNWAQYSNSDIHLFGDGYDFTLHDVAAKDRQSKFSYKTYLNPEQLTIPQFNLRLGYFITDHLVLTMGYDHMKYVMVNNQASSISGTIDSTASAAFAGTYENTSFEITPSFLLFEHTNGLNYGSIDVDYYGCLWQKEGGNLALGFQGGVGAGIYVPRSDVSLFNEHGANVFHVAGWGVDAHMTLRFDFLKWMFLQGGVKTGFVSLPDVLTFDRPGYGADHNFSFIQEYGVLGFCYPLIREGKMRPE